MPGFRKITLARKGEAKYNRTARIKDVIPVIFLEVR
jgi:hypothetical protein